MENCYAEQSCDEESVNPSRQNSLATTQELVIRHNESTLIEDTSRNVWATLIPLIQNLDLVELRRDSFQLGRDPRRCHVLLESHHLPREAPENMDISCVSREHFQMFRDKDVFGLEDLSRNGTFINGIKVGENNIQILQDGDTIGVLDEEFSLYVFISEDGPRKNFGATLCDLYHMGSAVGAGATSRVYEAWRREDCLKVAVKVINKTKWPNKYSAPDDLLKEVDILKNLDHPGITKVLNVIETPSCMNLVMEFAEGGELFEMLDEDVMKRNLDERVAKFQFYQICSTIDYLHSMNVCHRDLKLENLLLVSKSRKSKIKVSDFGLSKVSNSFSVLQTFVGSPLYIAPEIICSAETGGSYSLKSDCWSLGVILFTLLSGTQPFRQKTEQSLHRKITEGNFSKMEGRAWEKITNEAKNLVECLLVVNPEQRLKASQILQHKWFSNDKKLCEEARKVLFEEKSNNDSGRGLSTRKVVTNLEVLSTKENTPVKKRIRSFNESDLEHNCHNKKIRVEASVS